MKLEPCPFCGSEHIGYVYPEVGETFGTVVQCVHCGARGPLVCDEDGESEAATKWNQRSGREG